MALAFGPLFIVFGKVAAKTETETQMNKMRNRRYADIMVGSDFGLKDAEIMSFALINFKLRLEERR